MILAPPPRRQARRLGLCLQGTTQPLQDCTGADLVALESRASWLRRNGPQASDAHGAAGVERSQRQTARAGTRQIEEANAVRSEARERAASLGARRKWLSIQRMR